MAQTRTPRRRAPRQHEARLARLEHEMILRMANERQCSMRMSELERRERLARLPLPAAQTSADPLTDEERAEAEADAVLRHRMATEVRDWWLTTFADELVGKDLNFAALLWIEMVAVAIAGAVDLEGDVPAQLAGSMIATNQHLNRRVRTYVEQRQAAPETLQ